MFVDDDTDDQELFCEALADVDPTVTAVTASSAKAAMEHLTKATSLPDVIFLDINMPVVNGWDCLVMLKSDARLRAVPVIMYSTSNHAQDREKANALGALGCITKPSDYQILKENLLRTLAFLRTGSAEFGQFFTRQ